MKTPKLQPGVAKYERQIETLHRNICLRPETALAWLTGALSEQQMCIYIKHILLRQAQKDWLAKKGLDIADLLNGRYKLRDSGEVQAIYDDWNKSCGVRMFGFTGIGEIL